MKNKIILLVVFVVSALSVSGQARLKLNAVSLMHEMRSTTYPLNGTQMVHRYVSLQWPLRGDIQFTGTGLDTMNEESFHKLKPTGKNYQVRISQDPTFQTSAISTYTSWPFFNPENNLRPGHWFWQYGYVDDGGETQWSGTTQAFEIIQNADKFAPPTYRHFIKDLPKSHPRVLVFKDDWDNVIEGSKNKPERSWYIEDAEKILKKPIVDFNKEINTDLFKGIDNEYQLGQMMTRESRRFVDAEEANLEVLIRAYALTKDKKYADATIQRFLQMVDWKKSPYMKGDFNQATYLLLASLAYDTFFDLLDEPTKAILLAEVKDNGTKIFRHFANHLENHIADNHNWQMNLRIFSFAAFAVYGDLEEAEAWADYSYNIWRARFPGLNEDGGWHNGDSYFQVNVKTLIEIPYFYSRVTGYDFFRDPWYIGNSLYVIYQQPPGSKSGGNGSGHQKVYKPNSIRVSYADALARLLNNPFMSEYLAKSVELNPAILRKAFRAKPGDLAWFRILCNKPLPAPVSLNLLPKGHVFPQTGLASFMSNMDNFKQNAMISFRSSPYGSTSHALANQNAFNTFFSGLSLFYSSGNHVSFVDAHSVFSHRAARAHNTILVNGMGQKIGVEGYGWIPRHYVGSTVGYVLGDASNAYGEVISDLWQKRAKAADIEFSPKNGWDKNHVVTFRRHLVSLGDATLTFIYDELEADEPVTWDYLLHTVKEPMKLEEGKNLVKVTATSGKATSDAYIFTNDKLETKMTDEFFAPAINWLRADAKGNFETLPNHWHFSATSPKSQVYRFATVIVTRHAGNKKYTVNSDSKGNITVGDWKIKANITSDGEPFFEATNTKTKTKVTLKDTTTIEENGASVVLQDQLPYLEI